MKTIRQRILTSFCTIAFIIILAIGFAVSWKLDSSTTRQTDIIEHDMGIHAKNTLSNYHRILDYFIQSIKQRLKNIIENNIANDHNIKRSLEYSQLKQLTAVFSSLGNMVSADFMVLYDLDGMHLASFPMNMDSFWVQKYYASEWGLAKKIKALMQEGPKSEFVTAEAVGVHDIEFLKAFGLAEKDPDGKGAICIETAGIIWNDFGEPMGVAVAGKFLNNYTYPLEQLLNSTGAASAIYQGVTPIASAGFNEKTDSHFDESILQIPPSVKAEIFDSPEGVSETLTFGSRSYISYCSPIFSSEGEPIGITLVAVPQTTIQAVYQGMISFAREAKINMERWLLAIGFLGLLIFIFVSLRVSAGIIAPINRVVNGLSENADELDTSATLVEYSNVLLAEGLSEQAEAIEEAFASLRQISSLTRMNSDNIRDTHQVVAETTRVIDEANGSMGQFLNSMRDISAASEETQKIVKTIDEIAFQTNILALNAAIEAARAGEAGAGFGVVAGEVRRLALRSSNAAQNTAELIESSILKIHEGLNFVTQSGETFSKVTQYAQKVREIMNNIANASQEQSLGIDQVIEAATNIENVIRQVLADSNELVLTSSKMHSRANQLKEFVNHLSVLVG